MNELVNTEDTALVLVPMGRQRLPNSLPRIFSKPSREMSCAALNEREHANV
jgi:hypothetical protein